MRRWYLDRNTVIVIVYGAHGRRLGVKDYDSLQLELYTFPSKHCTCLFNQFLTLSYIGPAESLSGSNVFGRATHVPTQLDLEQCFSFTGRQLQECDSKHKK